jgi:hypothetical protein
MKRALLLSLLVASNCPHLRSETLDAQRLADAIYLAEGGPRAKVPYGILSVNVRDAAEARAVCLRTIAHAWRDWSATRDPRPFFNFLADRYCPPSDSAGNRHWKHNVNYLYRHPRVPETVVARR